jgi:sporulation protein YlmC with PRC-barrel domain
MDVTRSLNGKQLMDCDVVDTDGEKIGRIGDMTFSFEDGELKLTQFVMAGSRWEEFLESIRVKPDRDPIFDASLIRQIGDKVELTTNVNSLKTTLDEDAVPKGEILWSKFKDKPIVDKDGSKVGNALDIDFDIDGQASLTVGGGVVEETLEALGLKADIDIIVHASTIGSIADEIHLNVSRDELRNTLGEELDKPEVKEARSELATHRGVVKVRLFTRPM